MDGARRYDIRRTRRSRGELWGLLALLSMAGAWAGEPRAIGWQAWSPQVFEQARREQRLVLLDVVAEVAVLDAGGGGRQPRPEGAPLETWCFV